VTVALQFAAPVGVREAGKILPWLRRPVLALRERNGLGAQRFPSRGGHAALS